MRKLAFFTGAFSLGIFLAQYLLPLDWLLPGAFVCLGLGWGSFYLPWEVRRRSVIICAALSLALGWNWLYVRQVQGPMEAMADTEGPAVMTLCGYAEETDYGARAAVKLEGFSHGRAMFYGDLSLLELEPGQTVSARVKFQSAARVRDTDITNFTSKGVFLLAYGRETAIYGPGTMGALRWWPARLGRAAAEKIGELYQGGTAGFLTAILTGDKSGLTEQDGIALSEAGLYHMMAVSGMHCGFLLALVTLAAGRHRRRLTAVAAIPALAFYALLTGGSPSVVRACIMLALLVAAPLFHRDSDPVTSLTAALFLILLNNPFAAASVSLQLSFAAMAGLLWLTPRLMAILIGEKRRGRVFRVLAASFSATMGALVFTTPLTAWYFGILVLVSPLSNLLCLWAAGLVFMLGLLSVAAGFLYVPFGKAAALAPEMLSAYILRTAHLLSRIPCHALYYTNPYLKYWLVYANLLFITAYFLKSRTRRKYAAATLLAAGMLAATVKLGQWRCQADLDAFVLDVGQGQCVLLSSEGRFALVDCGSGNSWISAGDAAADHLASLGCRQLDYLILTHYDKDHVSGIAALAERLDIAAVLAPETGGGEEREAALCAAEAAAVSAEFVKEVRKISLGGAELTVYPPVGEGGGNEEGLAVLAAVGELDLLVTGDMDRMTERQLLAAYRLPDLEILIAGHHGSRYSTSEELLEALQPETACVSVGSNSYGHPSEEVLERLARQGCVVWRTDLHGTVHLSLNREK